MARCTHNRDSPPWLRPRSNTPLNRSFFWCVFLDDDMSPLLLTTSCHPPPLYFLFIPLLPSHYIPHRYVYFFLQHVYVVDCLADSGKAAVVMVAQAVGVAVVGEEEGRPGPPARPGPPPAPPV